MLGGGHQCGEVGVALIIIELCCHMHELTAYVKSPTRIKKLTRS